MAYLGKEYKFVKQEKLVEFIKAADPENESISKIGEMNLTTKLVKNGDTYTTILTHVKGTRETSFQSGVEFDDMVMGKVPVKATYTVDGNKITQVIKRDGKEAVITREYSGDELILTIKSDSYDGVAKVYFIA